MGSIQQKEENLTAKMTTEAQIKALEDRTQANDELARALKRENRELVKLIAQLQINFPPPNHAGKWQEIKAKLTTILSTVYKQVLHKNVTLEMCHLNLRRVLTARDPIWNWELVYPEESGSGRHFKVLNLNPLMIMPPYSDDAEPFVRFLLDEKHISQFIVI
jgi:hypothetical protein